MSQKIQRNPYGLLGLTDSKAGGANPNVLLDEVRPVIDLTQMLAVQQRLSIIGDIAVPVIGINIFPITLTEPQPGEIWMMRAVTAYTTVGITGANYRFVVGVSDIRNSSFTCLSDFQATGSAANQQLVTGRVINYIWRPGDQLALHVIAVTDAVATRGVVLFDRIAI